MNKIVDIKSAIDLVQTGNVIMVGGFTNTGCPLNLVYELAEHKDVKHLTIIAEDFGWGGLPYAQGPYSLLKNGQLDEIVVSFFGHKEAYEAVERGEVKLTLIPQGTLADRIRAGGSGIGGGLHPYRCRYRSGRRQGNKRDQRQKILVGAAAACRCCFDQVSYSRPVWQRNI